VAAGLVWTISLNGVLYGVDPASGQIRQQATIGTPANHFSTPSAGDGLLLAAAANQVIAFPASGSGTPAAASPGATPSGTQAASTATPTANGATTASTAGLPAVAIAGIVIGALVVIGAAGWLVRRARRRAP
jgi:hypothetical protein